MSLCAGDPSTAPLGVWNYANLAAHVAALVLNFTGGGSVGAVSRKYQTLVSPGGGAFAIWGAIYLWESIAVIAMLLPAYRGSKVVSAIGPWWCFACVCQGLWIPVWTSDSPIFAQVLIVGDLVGLIGVNWAADRIGRLGLSEYWLLRAPFSLHTGWVIAASSVGFNIVADYLKASAGQLLSIAIVSLAVVLMVASLCAIAAPKPNPIICIVAAWATWFIHVELRNPEDLRNKTYNPVAFDDAVITGVRGAALAVCVTSLGLAVVAVLLVWLRSSEKPAVDERPKVPDTEME